MRRVASLVLVMATVAGGAAFAVKSAPDFYASRPYFERPVSLQAVPEGLTSLSAEECGACHVDFYEEWQQSIHAQAWSDPQFQGELRKDPAVSWLCVNCHTPLVNQLDSLVTRLEDGDVSRSVRRANPDFDPVLKLEGITCAACHVRDGAVEGPYGDTAAPHAVRYNPAFRTTEVCERCHQAVQEYPGKGFICTFQTGDEWRAGPYAADGGKTCQDCHMPRTRRGLFEGGEERVVGRHSWIGSGLRKGGEPNPALWESLATLIEPGIGVDPGPALPPGRGERTWAVRVTNENAGHMLPTGDPERAVIVALTALDASGDTLGSVTHRIARRYQWHPEVKKLSDNRLRPGESRTVRLVFTAPAGPYTLAATAVNERISDHAADYHRLPETYPRRKEVTRLEVPVP